MTAAVILFLSVALIVCAARHILLKRDLKQLCRTLTVIEKADTNMRLTTETFDKDIRVLCDAVNSLLDQQKSVMAESSRFSRGLKQAMTNISHDLRTPLTSAVGYIQMVQSAKTPEDKKQEYLEIIVHRLKTLSAMIEDLFEYTQIIEGRTAQNMQKINLCNVLRDTLSVYYNEFISRQFTVEITIPDSPVYLICDEGYLKRVVQNLIKNVLVHGTGYFKLVLEGRTILFQNQAANPAAIDTERLFDRFYTADLARSNHTAGLGLAIVKELVQNMHGGIQTSLEGGMLSIWIHL